MPSRLIRLAALAATAAAVAAIGASPASARMSILYEDAAAVREIVHPAAGPGLTPARGAFRQDPGVGGLGIGDGNDALYRIGKVSAAEILGLPADAIAARLKQEIDTPKHGAQSHLVAIDEIGNTFNDGRARITYRTVTFRGKTLRIGSHMKLVITRNGWRLERRAVELLPTVDPQSPGSRLSEAMRILAATPSPYGGSYASRVHIYVAPAFSSSIGAGRGEHHNLGADGKPHRATWRGVMPALALSGGVWLEMYHGYRGGGTSAYTAKEWRTVPGAFASYLTRFGGSVGRLHFLMSGVGTPAGATGCATPMACQWMLAEAGANRRIMDNGVGTYHVKAQAAEWLAEFNRRYTA
jgi:hypothetical protein